MRIALVIPEFLSGSSFLQPPLGMLYCATLLERDGYVVDVIDVRAQSIPLKRVAQKVSEANLIVVTTTPYDQVQNFFVDYRLQYALRTVNFLKEQFPQTPIAVCGSHSTIRPDLILRDSQADIVVIGEYELTIRRLARAIFERVALKSVPNLVLRNNDEAEKTAEDLYALHPELADDVMPAYHKVDMNAYYGDHYVNNQPVRRWRWAAIQGSRGCPYSCTFCFNFWGQKVRKKSAEAVVAEMKLLEQKFGVEELFFIDFTFTLDHTWVMDICTLIQKENLRIGWAAETRCDLMNEDLARAMAAANCKRIWLGIESFDTGILKCARKYETSDVIYSAFQTLRQSGIEPSAFIMLGLPGESIETLNRTIRGIYDFQISYTQSVIISTPRFGTAYYDLAKQQYPYLGEYWQDLDAIKGLVANEMSPHLLQRAINLMKNRNFLYNPTCPKIQP